VVDNSVGRRRGQLEGDGLGRSDVVVIRRRDDVRRQRQRAVAAVAAVGDIKERVSGPRDRIRLVT